MNFFTETFRRHLREPVGGGTVEPADGVGEARSDECRDLVVFSLKLDGDRIVRIRYQAYGCAAVIAGGSLVCEQLEGTSREEAARIDAAELASRFGGVPPAKMKCLETVCRALSAALLAASEKGRTR